LISVIVTGTAYCYVLALEKIEASMIKKTEFRSAVQMAVQNIIKHGDTDIFQEVLRRMQFLIDRASSLIQFVIMTKIFMIISPGFRHPTLMR
jgi:hypothetical protein